jgi:Zn-dependent protease with chaperone function
MTQMAIDADEKGYPDLWKFVRDIANKVDAPVPNNIAIGLEPTFYATSANVKVLSSDKSLSGETLYISLPLMRLFSREEFGAVVGHELGHFKGSDVRYTMKFAPLYRALSTAVSSAADQGKIMAIPALSVLSFLLNRFSESEREISRQREFEADRVGAAATSENALCAALIKVTAFSNFWGELSYDLVENLEFGRPVKNLSKLYASRVAFDTDADASRTVVQQNLDYKVSHPTDTHPTLSDRLKNLNATDDFTSLDMGFLDDSSLKLVKDADVLEIELTLVQQKVYQVTGVAHYE